MRSTVSSLIISLALVFLYGAGAVPEVFVINTTLDTHDAIPGDGDCDDGTRNCSARAAAEEANASALGGAVLNFDIPGGGKHTIVLHSAFPSINVPITIDGLSQPGSTCEQPLIAIDVNGIFQGGVLVQGGHSTIRGIEVMNVGGENTFGYGVHILSDDNLVEYVQAHDSWGGIVVAGNNNTVQYSTASTNRFSGLTTYGNSNMVVNNVSTGNEQGAYSEGGDANLFEDNQLLANSHLGMFVKDGVTNTVVRHNTMTGTSGVLDRGTGTVVQDNQLNGIDTTDFKSTGLELAVNPATVIGNQVSGFFIGIFVESSGQKMQTNTVSGNGHGIVVAGINGTTVADVVMQQNSVLQNSGYGVSLIGNVANLTIGGITPELGNVIAQNGKAGVSTFDWLSEMFGNSPGTLGGFPGNGLSILENSIYGNGGLGIDLATTTEGFTPNDPGDLDTGPNNFQNFPVLTGITKRRNGRVVIRGTLSSLPHQFYRLEFFANTRGEAQGQTFLYALRKGTRRTGKMKFHVLLEAASGNCLTVTASLDDQSHQFSTSEFSACLMVP